MELQAVDHRCTVGNCRGWPLPFLPESWEEVENGGPVNERKLILEVHPYSTKNHDYGRKG